jgi:origin recognition complex subunit 2
MLQERLVLEVNGFFPSLTIKEIVDSIADDLLELSKRPAGMLECLEMIEEELCSELFIIIHNLDGPMLQSNKSQDVLSRLAQMEHIHLVASIDHINAPLIWDQAKLSRYNFVWWDVTSLQPYNGETQFESSLLVQKSGGLALSSLSSVFHSLTTNARSIFIIMVHHHLRNHKDPTYLGMPFKDLYSSAREALLVSSDLALRAQLTEFLDHRLARQRRSPDGSELLQLPIDSTVLQHFLEQVEGSP